MNSWLDTQTKALLQKTPPEKLAPPNTYSFSLILLSIYRHDANRLTRAMGRICGDSKGEAEHRFNQKLPLLITSELTHADALLGQFELVSCDAISVFIPDRVIKSTTAEYLNDLFESLLLSDEFREANIQINGIPNTERGQEFVDQFVGKQQSWPVCLSVPQKKARIMMHWAGKIGADLRLVD